MISYKNAVVEASMLDLDINTRTVKACWARMDMKDLDQDVIVKGAFDKTIVERGPSGKNAIWSLIDHMASLKYALGKPKELYVEGDMLVAVTKIADTDLGRDVSSLYSDGLITEHSIGFMTLRSDEKADTRFIRETMLFEGSAVLWGANPETPTLGIKELDINKQKLTLNQRLEKLFKAFKNGSYTDETFSLMEIEIKQIQAEIEALSTNAGAIVPPSPDTSQKGLLDALKQFNQQFAV